MHQTHAVRIASRRHAGEQPGQAVEIPSIKHTGGRATQAQVTLPGPVRDVVGALMAVERVARHLIRVIAGRTQTLTRRVHAGGLKILIRLERLVAARHAIEGCPLLERKRVNRHMMRSHRQHAIERTLPTRCGLPGKSAHKVARHVKPSVLDRRDGSERLIGIVNAADGGKFGVIERLHAQRDACDTNLGKRNS